MVTTAWKRGTVKASCMCGLACVLLAGVLASTQADGLPGEHVVTQRWRDLGANRSAMNNAALLIEEDYLTLRLAQSLLFGGSFYLTEAGITYPLGLHQSIGFSYLVSGAEAIDQSGLRVEAGRFVTEENGTASDLKNFFALSYANNLWRGLSLGGNVTVAYETNFGEPLFGVGLDAGMTWRLVNNGLLGTHVLGVSGQNLLAPKIGGNTYARNVKFTWDASFWEHFLTAGFDIDLKDLFVMLDTEAFPEDEGLTLGELMETDFAARVGVWLFKMAKLTALAGNDYWGAAAGVNLPVLNRGRDLAVDYQFTSLMDNDAGNMHTVYLRGNLGMHREEIYASRIKAVLDVGPNDLYLKALKLYQSEQYWDALFVFGQIRAQFPEFFKNDWVNYFMGSCLEELDMRKAAVAAYEQVAKKYRRSRAIANANLGLMRIAYRENNDGGVEKYFKELNKPNAPDSIKYHSYYLMAQTQQKNGNLSEAVQLYDLVASEHPQYAFAQHSKAVALLSADPPARDEAIHALANVLKVKPQNATENEIVNRSRVMLGYIYYEELTLSKAAVVFSEVPTSSVYFHEAMLGIGWTAIKSEQYEHCFRAARALAANGKSPVIRAEGMLLEGYAYMLQEQFTQAVNVLQDAAGMIEKPIIGQDSVARARTLYDGARNRYRTTAAAAVELADKESRPEIVIRHIDSLEVKQTAQLRTLESYQQFFAEYEKMAIFNRNREQVKSDIDYALAVATNRVGSRKATQKIDKINERVEQTDEEIERLRKELDQMEGAE